MIANSWLLKPEFLFSLSPIIPVLVIENLDDVLPLAKALIEGGIKILEITLRTPVALDAIRLLRKEIPEAVVGAGTVLTSTQLNQCAEAGAQFAISPGLTRELLQSALQSEMAYIPGAASLSELMEGVALGYSHYKFFPAEVAGGVAMLKAIQGPLPELRFCATGGVNEKNYLDYLSLDNVKCVGGTWIVPKEAIKQKSWHRITELAVASTLHARQ